MISNVIDTYGLEEKVAITTGEGGAKCGSMAIALDSIGSTKVAILDIGLEKAEKMATGTEKTGGNAIVIACNVLSTDEPESYHESVRKKW